MGKPYSLELDAFSSTYEWVKKQKVANLRLFLERWGNEHVAVVGSGGSYSAARIVALFRELSHHAVTTTHTPLEFLSLISRLSPRVLLLSAEGKNKDILASLSASADADLAACAMTLTTDNALVARATSMGTPRVFSYEMDWVKDGYLATNSLLATVLLMYRAFFGDEDFLGELGPIFAEHRLVERRRHFQDIQPALRATKQSLLVLHSADATAFAVDLASKLVEAAVAPVQVTDLRQFAHGQHLLLSVDDRVPAVIVAYSAADEPLARATGNLFPAWVSPVYIEIGGTTPQDIAITGLLDAMFLAEALATEMPYDIGDPPVPSFGRAIHQLDPTPLLAGCAREMDYLERAARRKGQIAKIPAAQPHKRVYDAAENYLKRLIGASIRAVVFDFDGTLCRAEDRFDPMSSAVVTILSNLVRSGLTVAIATGRGGSLRKSFLSTVDPVLWPRITVGYYSGALIKTLDQPFDPPSSSPGFEELEEWVTNTFLAHRGRPICQQGRLGQHTIRVGGSNQSVKLLSAVRAWLGRTGRVGWRAYASGHSVDVLDDKTSKRNVIAHLVQDLGLDPATEILRIGDSGQEDGNDFELLSEGLSLSCDGVSADLESCWNFSPKGTNQVEATVTYLRALVPLEDGIFRLSESALLPYDGVA